MPCPFPPGLCVGVIPAFHIFLYSLYHHRPPHTLAHTSTHACVIGSVCTIWFVLLGRNSVHVGVMSCSGAPCLPSARWGCVWSLRLQRVLRRQRGEPRTGFLKVPLKEYSSSEVLDEFGVLLEAQWTVGVLALSSPQEDHHVNGSHSGRVTLPPFPSPPALFPVPLPRVLLAVG